MDIHEISKIRKEKQRRNGNKHNKIKEQAHKKKNIQE